MSNTEVLCFFMLDYDEGWGIRKHSHDNYQLYYITAGRGEMSIGNEKILLVEGLCIVIHPEVEHELSEMEKGTLSMIEIEFQIYDDVLKKSIENAHGIQRINSWSFPARMFELSREWNTSLPFRKPVCDLLLSQILYEYLRIDAKTQHINQLLLLKTPRSEVMSGLPRQVAEYVEHHCFDSFSLEAMAQEMNYNKNYLCKIFKNSTGHTIVGYANSLKVSRAIELICYTEAKLNEIAEISGFHDIHYFTKVFKKITGRTPGELRLREGMEVYTDTASHGQFTYRYYNRQSKTKTKPNINA